jgi:uncharacterized membrane-anchored protein YitT (DUF2179 family)
MENKVNKRLQKQQRIERFRPIIDYGYVIIGSFIVALAFNLFLAKFQVASGGVSGISIIIHHLFGIKPAYTQWTLNIPLFALGVLLLGKQFGLKSFVGTILLPFFVFLTESIPTITDSVLLASIYGGVGVGLGLGLVFRGRASTGGTDLLAQILHKYLGLSLGIAVLLLDGLVVGSAGIVFGPEGALYALIGLYVTSKTIDGVQVGLGYAKVAYIITNQIEKVQNGLLHDLDRGVTRISAYGGYTNQEKPMLMCVVDQQEIAKLKQLVQKYDREAFVIVTPASEVLGEGFRRY